MSIPYKAPTYKASAYNCPFCGAFAAQRWLQMSVNARPFDDESDKWFMAACTHCSRSSMWREGIMITPDVAGAPQPHPDLPTELIADFEEACSVLTRSPRSSAALLRLVLQKLCLELGEKGDKINDNIAGLVAKGLPPQVQQALDIIRVVGNEQVHPGQLDVRDKPEIALELFTLVNFIVDDRIARPRVIAGLYSSLPAEKLSGIERRDAPKASMPKP